MDATKDGTVGKWGDPTGPTAARFFTGFSLLRLVVLGEMLLGEAGRSRAKPAINHGDGKSMFDCHD